MAADPVIEQIEAQLRESRFKTWDVETFLADRHQAKIDALTSPANHWERRGQVAREVATAISALIGLVTVMTLAGVWLLTGEFPLQRGLFDRSPPALVAPPQRPDLTR